MKMCPLPLMIASIENSTCQCAGRVRGWPPKRRRSERRAHGHVQDRPYRPRTAKWHYRRGQSIRQIGLGFFKKITETPSSVATSRLLKPGSVHAGSLGYRVRWALPDRDGQRLALGRLADVLNFMDKMRDGLSVANHVLSRVEITSKLLHRFFGVQNNSCNWPARC